MEEARTVDYSRTTITELMIPSFANFSGKVHGGTLLSLMDKVAYVCASKHSGAYCVTVSVDGVEFKEPVEVGELVSLAASVNYVGNSSMIIGIRVESLKPKTGEKKHTNSCYFTMVAKNEDGSLMTVPKLILETPQDVRRFYDGRILKSMRKQITTMLDTEVKSVTEDEMIDLIDEERCIVGYPNK
ncbi:acyl-CoA thioesterase [Paracrocinitomix mangrovi]|uniref:acyl-CoA thioesterase n=1 Tax=Paracrocinitomix mangrovi TaxID=2862509 RepID=UPI001C8D4F95|nr:acyl-CoA thioesterase [Paracrocinitomix mangrovi]UKN02412.1 acyl-CoA thioesterase [Paracrocinitomix mangrovi]